MNQQLLHQSNKNGEYVELTETNNGFILNEIKLTGINTTVFNDGIEAIQAFYKVSKNLVEA